MSNTHGWIGVDLDGTLAKYDRDRGEDHIGKPVPLMVARVKNLLQRGYTVKIFTARVSGAALYPERVERTRRLIQAWALEHIGQVLEVTNEKDYGMMQLFDDRAVQVIPNTGRIVINTKEKK